jgi:hypothetical protein
MLAQKFLIRREMFGDFFFCFGAYSIFSSSNWANVDAKAGQNTIFFLIVVFLGKLLKNW